MRIEGIEYNIIAYLQANEGLILDPKVSGFDSDDVRESVMFVLDGGEKQNDSYSIVRMNLQVMARSKSSEKAKKQVFKVFNLIDNKFGLELPEYSDGTYQYEAVTVPQISAMQIPSYLGADNNFVHMWVVNFTLTGVLEH